jgi:hypothetical protein
MVILNIKLGHKDTYYAAIHVAIPGQKQKYLVMLNLFSASLIYIFNGVFSQVVLLLFLYSVVIVARLFVWQLRQKLKEKAT